MRDPAVSISKNAIMLMGLRFLPDLEINMETSRSLEQVRYAIGKCIRPAATNLPSETAVGSIKGNQFRLHFKKPGRNSWGAEFNGSFASTNNHVKIVVRCGFSDGIEAFTVLYWILIVLGFVSALGKFSTGNMDLNSFFLVCLIVVTSFAVPCIMFWSEFRYDRIKMRSILDGIESERYEAK